jgi:peptidoglycan hydrolase-like protein with peptidoglycan-binding domain
MPKLNDTLLLNACDTGLIRGLNLQIIAVLNSIAPNILVDFTDIEGVVAVGNKNNPFLQAAAKNSLKVAVTERRKAEGNAVELIVNSAYRTVAQQYLLNLQFQQVPDGCGIQAVASPGSSNHESGLALDIQDRIGWEPYLERHSYVWFGPGDEPHFDYRFFAATRDDIGTLGIRAFQILWNKYNPSDPIKEDGDFGPQTEGRLRESLAEGFNNPFPRVLRLETPPMTGDDVRKVQESLVSNKLTKIDIPINSIFDSVTAAAVKQFQEATKRLAVDSAVGSQTLKALGLV